MLDQRVLPHEVVWHTYRTWQEVARAIQDMVVRGAPAIGCVAAYGLVLASRQKKFKTLSEQIQFLKKASHGLLAARPTAVNLKWALERMMRGIALTRPAATLSQVRGVSSLLEQEAIRIEEEDRAANRQMGLFGASLLPKNATVLTICNTGSLATAGLGTAFGVIWTAFQQKKIKNVLACETRPYLQGARLTAWELQQEKIPFQLITDNMAGHLMKTDKVDAILVGADRIAANGDTANKIGTYSLAVLAKHHGIPFYVVAPTSTVDLKTASGKQIPIEERSAEEVTTIRGIRITPKNIRVRHPAFDVTPSELISAIITEKGIFKAPFRNSLRKSLG